MLFLFILGNFNKSTKPRLPECRAVLSGREPRALPQLRMTSMSHQVAGTIWMLDSLLVTPFGNVIVLHYAWHRSYTIHNAAAGAREPVWEAEEPPELSTACLKTGFAGGGIRHLLHQICHPSPTRLTGRHRARICGGPCPALTAMLLLKDTSTGFSELLFWGKLIHLLFMLANPRCWFHFALLSSATCMHSEHNFWSLMTFRKMLSITIVTSEIVPPWQLYRKLIGHSLKNAGRTTSLVL